MKLTTQTVIGIQRYSVCVTLIKKILKVFCKYLIFNLFTETTFVLEGGILDFVDEETSTELFVDDGFLAGFVDVDDGGGADEVVGPSFLRALSVARRPPTSLACFRIRMISPVRVMPMSFRYSCK